MEAKSLPEALGAALAGLRRARGLSLRQLAASAGVSATFLGEVERGLKEPSSETLRQVAAALDVSLADVLFRVADALAQPEQASPESATASQLRGTLARLAGKLERDDLYTLVRLAEFLLAQRSGGPG